MLTATSSCSVDKDRLRQRIWLGKKATSSSQVTFTSLMTEHDSDGHTSSTHGVGESGEAGQRDQIDIWLDELIANAKEAGRKAREQADMAEGRANADVEAAKRTDAALSGKGGRRSRKKGGGGPAGGATGTPLPEDFTPRSAGSGGSGVGNSWGFEVTGDMSSKFTKHPRLSAKPFTMPLHVQKAFSVLNVFEHLYFEDTGPPPTAPTSRAEGDELENIGFKVVNGASGELVWAKLHRHDPSFKTLISEAGTADDKDAFEVYEGWRGQQSPGTIGAVAILISEGLDARPPLSSGRGVFGGGGEIGQMSADIRASAEASATAVQETGKARNADRELQRSHEKAEAGANRLLERERMLATERVERQRHEQMIALLQGMQGAPQPPPPPPPPPAPAASLAPKVYDSLELLLQAAEASAHAPTFRDNEYTLANVYSALGAGELMADLAQLIPALGVRRRIISCLMPKPL